MTILPFFNQFIVPTFISIYAVVSVFLPQSSLQGKGKATTHEKKVIAAHVRPTISQENDGDYADKKERENSSFMQNSNNNKEKSEEDGSSLIPESTTNQLTPTPTSVSPATHQDTLSTLITAKTTIIASGKTINLVMKYPSVGGAISGTMTGDCSGSLNGTYDGPQSQTLSGNGSASCSLGFMNVGVNITYSGRLTSATSAHIDYTVSALGKSESGSTDVSLGN